MLETERAGAKALVVFMDDWPRQSEQWKLLRNIQADEAHNCALLGEQLKRSHEPYSHATGEFFDKAVAVKGSRARIELLVRGLRWAVRRFEESLSRIPDPEARGLIERMRDSHLRSIAACEKVVQLLPK